MKTFLEIQITLETCEEFCAPLHIGGVTDPFSDITNDIARFPYMDQISGSVRQDPIIPGPSLKGAWRYAIEEYLIDTYYDSNQGDYPAARRDLRPCVPSPNPSLAEGEKKLIYGDKKYKPNCSPSDRNPIICPACYLHGAVGMRGFARTPFLKLAAGQLDVVLETYELRIDRADELGTAGNRPVALVRPGTRFEGVLRILLKDTVKGWQLGQVREKQVLWGRNPSERRKEEMDLWLRQGWENQPRKILKDFVEDMLQEKIQFLGGYLSKGYGAVKIHLSIPPGASTATTLDEYFTEQLRNARLPTD